MLSTIYLPLEKQVNIKVFYYLLNLDEYFDEISFAISLSQILE